MRATDGGLIGGPREVIFAITKTALACAAVVVVLCVGACIEWSTNSQGQLQSLGVPGLPVWQSKALTEQNRLAAEGDLAATPGSEIDAKAARLTSFDSDADWLAEINRWRRAAGVRPVGENAGLSNAAAAHARYLVMNGPRTPLEFRGYTRTIDGAAHSENSDSPYFSEMGREAAHTGDVAFDRDPIADVQGLIDVPFHRLSILAPWVRVAGYGSYGTFPIRAASLVLRGSTPVGLKEAVVFPPDGSDVSGVMTHPEWPDPLAACAGYALPVGTPITAQIGASVGTRLESYSVTDESSGRDVRTCGFDFASYPTSRGSRALVFYGAIVLIPREPLMGGHRYMVNVKTHRQRFTWTFRVRGTEAAIKNAKSA